QLKGAIERFGTQKPHAEAPVRDEMNQVGGATAARREQVKGLRQDRRGGDQRFEDAFENLRTRTVRFIGGVEERDDRTGVQQNHAPCLRAIAALTADLASLAGLRA